jgi:hypothetical protein
MKKILFIGGSLNQTTMMFKVAVELQADFDCWFTAFYADGLVHRLAENGLLDFTILGGQAKRATETFFENNQLKVDYRGLNNGYDLVVIASDLIVPRNVRSKNIILIQEGMMTPENFVYQAVKSLRLPRFLGNTSMTGLSHSYQKFCVASAGFKEMFVKKGISPQKIEVTGIPNFDDLDRYRQNDFPHQNYVLSATSCLRETGQYEDRKAFIFKSLDIAGGRQLLFKLHPNENHARARREIEKMAPDALIFETGNTNHMIANCETMVTKYSSVLLTALGMGKQVFSDLDPAFAETLRPVQNGGTSASKIANICREYL